MHKMSQYTEEGSASSLRKEAAKFSEGNYGTP